MALAGMNESYRCRSAYLGQGRQEVHRPWCTARPRFQPCLDASVLVSDGLLSTLFGSILPVFVIQVQWLPVVYFIMSVYC